MVFAGLSILGLILISVGMTIVDDAYWAMADPITILLFAASAVMFAINFIKYR